VTPDASTILIHHRSPGPTTAGSGDRSNRRQDRQTQDAGHRPARRRLLRAKRDGARHCSAPQTSAPLRLQPQWRLYRRPRPQQAGPRPSATSATTKWPRPWAAAPRICRRTGGNPPGLAARLAQRREALSPPLQACGLISLPTYALAGDTERAAAELAKARRLSLDDLMGAASPQSVGEAQSAASDPSEKRAVLL
jgi:hypothetical protein